MVSWDRLQHLSLTRQGKAVRRWMDDGCAVIVVVPVVRFDSELAQALEEAENERDQKDKALQENTALGTEIYTLRRSLQVRVWNPAGTTPTQLPVSEISVYISLAQTFQQRNISQPSSNSSWKDLMILIRQRTFNELKLIKQASLGSNIERIFGDVVWFGGRPHASREIKSEVLHQIAHK